MAKYEPGILGDGADLPAIRLFLVDELRKIAAASTDGVLLQELNVAPLRPRSGMVVLADGTNWDPGSGQGFYGYYGSSWVKLG